MLLNSNHKNANKGRGVRSFFIAAICLFSLEGYGECVRLFQTQSLSVEGETLSAAPADLDGKGSREIIVVHKTGVHPEERRWISIFDAGDAGQYAVRQKWEVDPAAAMFDVGDVASTPGREIICLTGRGVSYHGRESGDRFFTSPRELLTLPTITPFPQKGLLPRARLFDDWKRDGSDMLLLPQLDALVFFSQNGSAGWRRTDTIDISPRAFLHSGGVNNSVFTDFSIHAEYRIPRLFVKDFNGDNHPDLILTSQESVYVHLRQADGRFSREPSATAVFPIRPSGKDAEKSLYIISIPVDVNGDGFVDIIVRLNKGAGKFLERRIIFCIFLHRRDSSAPYAQHPDQTIIVDGLTPGVNFDDVDGDGKKDLLLSSIRLGFWKIVQNLLSKRVNVETSIYLLGSDDRYATSPDYNKDSSYQLNITQGIALRGTMPTLAGDFNGDGHKDLLIARDNKIEINPGNPKGNFFLKPVVQSDIFTSPFMHVVDLNGDGRDDLIFYERERDGRISVSMNITQGEHF